MHRLVVLLISVFVATSSVHAEGALDGNWKLTTIGSAAESAVAILKVETKDGKTAASVEFSPPNVECTVTQFEASGATVTVNIRQTRTVQGRTSVNDMEFIGVLRKDAKEILGSTRGSSSDDRFRTRARLVASDKTTLAKDELIARTPLPEPMQKVQELNARIATLARQAQTEKDADKKKEATEQVQAARKEAEEQIPGFYREVVAKHADAPAALDAAMNLVRSGPRAKLTADEAGKLVALVRQQSEPYGPRFAVAMLVQAAEGLMDQKGLEAAALAAAEPAAKALTESHPLSIQSRALTAYKTALDKTGNAAEAKVIGARLAKLEAQLDEEYLAKTPPFKPEAYAGRKEKGANQVVVMELFTGVQCPPCVAADVAFDSLGQSYRPSELILIEYHMHIPGPDPLVNLEDIARWDYYRAKFPEGIRGTPSTIFNGKPAAGGGGGMANAESKCKQYRDIIDPLLEKTTSVRVGGKAVRSKDKIDVSIDVTGVEQEDDLKLRLVVVEDIVKFVGGNGVRFHHQVVRAMPGGAAGVAVNGKEFRHTAEVDIAEIRGGLDKYLTSYAEDRPFPQPGRPMEMKHLKVIALVQNEKTLEIVQATQIEVEGKPEGGAGGR